MQDLTPNPVWETLKKANLWQAAFIRPFMDQGNWMKHVRIWLSYAFGLLLVVVPIQFLIDDMMSKPLPYEQMESSHGELSKIVLQRRAPSYLVITKSDGNEERFFAPYWATRELHTRTGTNVTVWSQPGFEIFYGRIKRAREIRLDDESLFVFKQETRWRSALAHDNKDHYWFLAMIGFGLFLIAKPIWKHRKPI